MTKTLNKLGTEGKSLIKGICEYPQLTAYLMVKDRMLSPKVRNKIRSGLFHTVLEVLAKTIRQQKEINGIQIEKEGAILYSKVT